jgi:hypothetical protein
MAANKDGVHGVEPARGAARAHADGAQPAPVVGGSGLPASAVDEQLRRGPFTEHHQKNRKSNQ